MEGLLSTGPTPSNSQKSHHVVQEQPEPDLGYVSPGLLPADRLDRLLRLCEALHGVGHHQGRLEGGG